VRPLRIEVPQHVLARIARRIEDAHLPTTSRGASWQYDVDAAWFRDLVGDWRNGYDWRRAEA
jgi:hypothetical protein